MKKDNTSKKIDSKLLQESLLEYNHISELIKENAKNSYARFLNESEDEEEDEEEKFDVEEVEDTTEEPTDSENESESEEELEDSQEILNDDEDFEDEEEGGMDSEEEIEGDEESLDSEEETVEDEGDDTLGGEFEQYQVADGEYDLRNAKDDEIVKVYKLLKDTDGVTVVKDGDKVQLKDAENEYIIDLNSLDDSESDDNEFEIEIEDNMNESKENRVYEILLNEYDSHVGYTDNYQKKDVMTTDGVKEPGNGRDIDKGIPHETSKPWAKPNKKSGPFNKGAKNECGDGMETPLEEQSIARSGKRRMKGVKSPVPNTSGKSHPYNPANATVAGDYKASKVEESKVIEDYKKMVQENKKLKKMLSEVSNKIKEAAVTNYNLGGIIKLITENSTSKEEKKGIISRFVNEAKTVEESMNLYERISNELKSKPQNAVNINEEKQFNASNTEVINESKFYQDENLMNSLGLMHKIC